MQRGDDGEHGGDEETVRQHQHHHGYQTKGRR
jgi:hypothetical protein